MYILEIHIEYKTKLLFFIINYIELNKLNFEFDFLLFIKFCIVNNNFEIGYNLVLFIYIRLKNPLKSTRKLEK